MCHARWAHRRPESVDPRSHHHPGPWGWGGPDMPGEEGFGPWGNFGVRRPLRFLAHKLGLDEKQVVELARILDELKTERAQAAVDERRTLSEFADAFGPDQFDPAKAASARERRAQAAQRLSEKVSAALEKIHALLTPEQRARLAHFIRTGILSI